MDGDEGSDSSPKMTLSMLEYPTPPTEYRESSGDMCWIADIISVIGVLDEGSPSYSETFQSKCEYLRLRLTHQLDIY